MDILFITFNDVKNEKYGGGQCSKRNLEVLEKYGSVNIISIRKNSFFESFQSIISGGFPPLTEEKANEILNVVKQKKYSLIFLDSSLLGSIGKRVKNFNKDVQIFVFFHNVEYDYINVRMKKGIKQYIYRLLAKKHEGYSVIYADRIIALNSRDDNRLKQLYGRNADYILPISFDDQYKKVKESEWIETLNPIVLFVGSFGRSNYEGIKWFVQHSKILDQIELQVVGKGFEIVKNELEVYGCKVWGTVEDISKYYENASLVISPILFGGGMKVKIAEALMYGKTVFGTKEALEGYEDEKGMSLYQCNNIKDFDTCIMDWIHKSQLKFNCNSRKLFMEKYDTRVVERKFCGLMRYIQEKEIG